MLSPASAISPLASPQPAPSPAQVADLADSGHPGCVELLEELKLAGCLLEEEVDHVGRRDGCHEGGVRCRGGADGLRDGAPGCPGFPFVKTLGSGGQET